MIWSLSLIQSSMCVSMYVCMHAYMVFASVSRSIRYSSPTHILPVVTDTFMHTYIYTNNYIYTYTHTHTHTQSIHPPTRRTDRHIDMDIHMYNRVFPLPHVCLHEPTTCVVSHNYMSKTTAVCVAEVSHSERRFREAPCLLYFPASRSSHRQYHLDWMDTAAQLYTQC